MKSSKISFQNLFNNFVVSSGTDLYRMGTGVLISALLGRQLGVTLYGQYIAAIALAALFTSFADFGLSKLALRDIVDESESALKQLGALIVGKIFLSVIVFLCFYVAAYLDTESVIFKNKELLYWIVPAGLLSTFVDFIRVTIWSRAEIFLDNLIKVIYQTLSFLPVVWIFAYDGSLMLLVKIMSVVAVIYGLITLFVYKTRLRAPLITANTLTLARSKIVDALPIGAGAILVSFYFKIDILILSIVRSSNEVGWYSVAYSLIIMLMNIPMIFAKLILPILSRHITDTPLFKKIYEKSSLFLIVSGFVLSFWITAIGSEILLLLFGESFSESKIAIELFASVLPALFWVQLLTNTLISLHCQQRLFVISVINAIVTLVLDILLIPIFGFLGAVIATILSETGGVVWHLYALKKSMPFSPLGKGVLPTVLVGYLLWALMIAFPDLKNFMAPFLTIAFLFFAYVSGFIARDDVLLIRRLMGQSERVEEQ